MGNRYTCRDVRRQLQRYARALGRTDLALDEWSPGDGMTRYRVVEIGEHGSQRDHRRHAYWLGAREAWDALADWANWEIVRAEKKGFVERQEASS